MSPIEGCRKAGWLSLTEVVLGGLLSHKPQGTVMKSKSSFARLPHAGGLLFLLLLIHIKKKNILANEGARGQNKK